MAESRLNMKCLAVILVIINLGCSGQYIRGESKLANLNNDSIYPAKVLDTTYWVDSSMGYKIKCKEYPIGVDTSRWILISVGKDSSYKYKYLRWVSYGTAVQKAYPEDSVRKWENEITDTLQRIVIFGDWSDAVGRMAKQYLSTNNLLPGTDFKDTIPEGVQFVSESEDNRSMIYRTDYFVGGVFGERVGGKLDKVEPIKRGLEVRRKKKQAK